MVLYEPPIEIGDRSIDDELIKRIDGLVQHGKPEEALIVFLREVVKIPAQEIEAAKTRPTWPGRVADIHSSIREMYALESYKFDAARIGKLKVPVLLLMGSETASHHKRAIAALSKTITNQRVHVFNGQGHNAMDTAPTEFVEVVKGFLLA